MSKNEFLSSKVLARHVHQNGPPAIFLAHRRHVNEADLNGLGHEISSSARVSSHMASATSCGAPTTSAEKPVCYVVMNMFSDGKCEDKFGVEAICTSLEQAHICMREALKALRTADHGCGSKSEVFIKRCSMNERTSWNNFGNALSNADAGALTREAVWPSAADSDSD